MPRDDRDTYYPNRNNQNNPNYNNNNYRPQAYALKRDIPKGWLDYSNFNKAVQLDTLPFTIFPIKAPLDNERSNNCLASHHMDDKIFDWEIVLDEITAHFQEYFKVVDLTGTAITNGKYYFGERVSKNFGLKYDKIQCQGFGSLPARWQLDRFNSIMDQYANYVNGATFKRTFPDYDNADATPPTVLVHCTHGVNRTGYFISNYLIECHSFSANKAINLFEKMRGHSIKYGDYRSDLKEKEMEYLKNRLLSEMPHMVELPISSDSDDDFNEQNSDGEKKSKKSKKKKVKKSKKASSDMSDDENAAGTKPPGHEQTNVIFLSSDDSDSSSSSASSSSRDTFGRSKPKKSKKKRRRSRRRSMSRSRRSKSRDRRSKSRDRRSKSRDKDGRMSKSRIELDKHQGPQAYTIIRKSQTRTFGGAENARRSKSRERSFRRSNSREMIFDEEIYDEDRPQDSNFGQGNRPMTFEEGIEFRRNDTGMPGSKPKTFAEARADARRKRIQEANEASGFKKEEVRETKIYDHRNYRKDEKNNWEDDPRKQYKPQNKFNPAGQERNSDRKRVSRKRDDINEWYDRTKASKESDKEERRRERREREREVERAKRAAKKERENEKPIRVPTPEPTDEQKDAAKMTPSERKDKAINDYLAFTSSSKSGVSNPYANVIASDKFKESERKRTNSGDSKYNYSVSGWANKPSYSDKTAKYLEKLKSERRNQQKRDDDNRRAMGF